jgi:hypothetical protein
MTVHHWNISINVRDRKSFGLANELQKPKFIMIQEVLRWHVQMPTLYTDSNLGKYGRVPLTIPLPTAIIRLWKTPA